MFQNITQITEKKVILLMIPHGGEWHYIVLKTSSSSLRGIISKLHPDFHRFIFIAFILS